MARQKAVTSERAALEARIGNRDLIPRPPVLLRGIWNAEVQAEVIISRVTCALRSTVGVLSSDSDDTAALKFNKSALGHPLRESSNQTVLLAAAKVLAEQAGINAEGVEIQKKHGPLSNVFGPTIYVVLPDEEAAQKLYKHVQLSKIAADRTDPIFVF